LAGDWIPIRVTLPDDLRVMGIAAKCGLSQDAVMGKLVRFWAWADQRVADGRLGFATRESIDMMLSCDGFTDALLTAKWLVEDADGTLFIPEYEKFLGRCGKRRVKNAEAAAAHRKSNPKPRKQAASSRDDDVSVTAPLPKEQNRTEQIPTTANKPTPPPKNPEVDEALSQYGVRKLEAVQGIQCSPQTVLRAVKFLSEWHCGGVKAIPPQWLVKQLPSLRDFSPVESKDYWGEPCEAFQKAAKRQQTEARAPKPSPAEDQGRKRLEELEARYGATLNGMTDAEMDGLSVGLTPPLRKVYRDRGWKAVRPMLLELLKSRDGPRESRPPSLSVHRV
jgi:hypothetical protein